MKYIIAAVEGTRFDLAPQLECEHAKTYTYSTFRLIIATFGNYEKTYKETYDKVSAYVTKVNAEFKNNNYFKGAYRAEMLTPNEHGEYNDSFCATFRNWLAAKILDADQIIVSHQMHDIPQGRINVHANMDAAWRVARRISDDIFDSIDEPGCYNYGVLEKYGHDADLERPTFRFGYSNTISVQIVDRNHEAYGLTSTLQRIRNLADHLDKEISYVPYNNLPFTEAQDALKGLKQFIDNPTAYDPKGTEADAA